MDFCIQRIIADYERYEQTLKMEQFAIHLQKLGLVLIMVILKAHLMRLYLAVLINCFILIRICFLLSLIILVKLIVRTVLPFPFIFLALSFFEFFVSFTVFKFVIFDHFHNSVDGDGEVKEE
jgi:hypothetical protein